MDNKIILNIDLMDLPKNIIKKYKLNIIKSDFHGSFYDYKIKINKKYFYNFINWAIGDICEIKYNKNGELQIYN